MMTVYASAATAVDAMKKGAYDYISKPFKIEDVQLIVKNAIEKKMLSDALIQADGIINKAAKKLNLSFRSMRYQIQKNQLKGKAKDNE